MSSGLRLSRTGKAAQCLAISSSLSARRRLLHRLFICSRRSLNAFVTASVFVSPVREARSEANFSVSWFRMFRAMFHYRLQFLYIATFHYFSNLFTGYGQEIALSVNGQLFFRPPSPMWILREDVQKNAA